MEQDGRQRQRRQQEHKTLFHGGIPPYHAHFAKKSIAYTRSSYNIRTLKTAGAAVRRGTTIKFSENFSKNLDLKSGLCIIIMNVQNVQYEPAVIAPVGSFDSADPPH